MYFSSSPAWSCEQRVAVDDVGILDAVQQHVHAADAEHGVVEVEAVEQAVMEVLPQFGIVRRVPGGAGEVLANRHQETASAAGRVADHVGRRGLRPSRP